jgi:hypothetical protein
MHRVEVPSVRHINPRAKTDQNRIKKLPDQQSELRMQQIL